MSIALISALSLVGAGCFPATAPAVSLQAAASVAATTAEDVVAQVDETLAAPEVETLDEATVKVEQRVDLDAAADQPLAFEGESDEEVLARLSAYLENLESMQGDFTQVAPSGAVSTGKFYLRRPGFLRFEYDPPTPLLIVANGGMVYVQDEALETTDSYPVGRTPLKYLLNKRVDLEKLNPIAIDRGVDTIAATFASDDDEAEGELTIIVNAPDMTLARWIVRDIQRGITVVSLQNVEEGVRLANRLFETPDAGGRFLKN